MTADQLIDGYVADVVAHLPRRQRADVARERRTLLTEEVDAAAVGRGSREEAARELLAGFGRPAEVAARYAPPAFLIDPADTRRFLILAVGGAVLIHVGVVLDGLIDPAPRHDPGQVAEAAWPIVLAWLGLLVVGFGIAAWIRRRRPDTRWKPHPPPTDRINRPGRPAALAFFALGALWLVSPDRPIRMILGDRATPEAYGAFAYDEGFLRLRGLVVLGVMIAGLAIHATLLWYGRWRPWIQQADMVHSLVVCAVLTWAIGAGPVFTAVPTDRAVKGAAALIVLVTLVDLGVRYRRFHVRQSVAVRG